MTKRSNNRMEPDRRQRRFASPVPAAHTGRYVPFADGRRLWQNSCKLEA